jgi:Domain of unknown function (DUF4288)
MAKEQLKGKYAAKLLFQYRIVKKIGYDKKRLCEESIVQFEATAPKDAVRKAKSIGKTWQFKYKNTHGNFVRFEFVGILELRAMGDELEKYQVWYEFKELVEPMERKRKILPNESQLAAIREIYGARPRKGIN